MRTKNASWYEVTVRHEQEQEDGTSKKITELYVVDGTSFTESEARILKELKTFVRSGLEIKNINPASYKEIFFSEDADDDKWYKAKISFITVDEETGVEKRTNVTYLVQASDIERALKNVEETLGINKDEYVTANLAETKVVDVFEY